MGKRTAEPTTLAQRLRAPNPARVALAIVLGIGMWLARTITINPVETFETTVDLSVKGVSDEQPSEPSTDPSQVAIVLRGQRSDLALYRRNPRVLRAFVDVTGLAQMTGRAHVEVDTALDRVEVQRVIPDEVTYSIKQKDQKMVAVQVRLLPGRSEGTPEPTAAPDQVRITGEKAMVDRVVAVEAAVREYELLEKGYLDCPVRPIDSRGQFLDLSAERKVTMEPSVVRVQIPSAQLTASVQVDPAFTGEPSKGYEVKSIAVDPPTVNVSAGPSLLEGTDATIPTEPIDLSGHSSDFTIKVSLRPPEGITPNEVSTVAVTVTIGKKE